MKKTYPDAVLLVLVEMLKEKRHSLGLSHEKLSVLSGVTRAAISHIENGKRKPSLLLCLKLAAAMEVSLGDTIKAAEVRVTNSNTTH